MNPKPTRLAAAIGFSTRQRIFMSAHVYTLSGAPCLFLWRYLAGTK